ncbi:MAG TPA: sulfur oxidation c-type cytochrome SoxX [Usitatibacter sp.]|nr:sulfur oxidation c-type cytochrome SoxX [Usitatibacter sp.]
MKKTSILAVALAGVAAGCAMTDTADETRAKAIAMMKASFTERGQAKLDRFDQDEVQRLCSLKDGQQLDKATAARLEKSQLALIKYPADGKYMGDWKAGERVAQSGRGGQYNDDPKSAAGGNCYACHQLSKAEMSFGTIGPSLYNFGKLRGFTPEMQKYAFGKVYNSQAFSACSSMPRFGHNKVLTEKQIQDVVALLMDPESPVNK